MLSEILCGLCGLCVTNVLVISQRSVVLRSWAKSRWGSQTLAEREGALIAASHSDQRWIHQKVTYHGAEIRPEPRRRHGWIACRRKVLLPRRHPRRTRQHTETRSAPDNRRRANDGPQGVSVS